MQIFLMTIRKCEYSEDNYCEMMKHFSKIAHTQPTVQVEMHTKYFHCHSNHSHHQLSTPLIHIHCITQVFRATQPTILILWTKATATCYRIEFQACE